MTLFFTWHILDLRKIPASPDLPEVSRRIFSLVEVPTGTPPPDKNPSESLLDNSDECEVLRKSIILEKCKK